MKSLFYLLSILSLSHFTLSLHAQEALEEDDTPHTSEAETESIAQKEIPITWKRFAVRGIIHYVVSAIFVYFFYTTTSIISNDDGNPLLFLKIIFFYAWMGTTLLLNIALLLLYAQKFLWTQNIFYRYGSDAVIQFILIFGLVLINKIRKSKVKLNFVILFFIWLFLIVPVSIFRSIVDLIDHFVVSRSIPYATAEEEKVQDEKQTIAN